MLRVSEIDAALAMMQAIGPRRYGHFDHDSHEAIGPFPPSPRVDARSVERKSHVAEGPKAPPLERFFDKETGQPLYRQRRG
jgi:hypothetical protein